MNTTKRIGAGMVIIVIGLAFIARALAPLELDKENVLMVGSTLSVVAVFGVGYSLYYWRERLRREHVAAGIILIAVLAVVTVFLLSRMRQVSPFRGSLMLGLVVLFLIYLVFIFLRAQARSNALRPVVGQLGLSLHPGVSPNPSDFPELPSGRQLIAANVMQGSYGGDRVTAFDSSYSTGGHRSRRTHRQTMICFESEHAAVPRLALCRKRLLGQHPMPFRRPPHEIVLENEASFTKRYRLWGEDPEAVRAVLSSPVVQFLEQGSGFNLEASQSLLVGYQPRHRIKAAQFHDALAEVHRIFSLLISAAGDTGAGEHDGGAG